MEPRNLIQGIDSASLCSQAGRYDNPIPIRFLAPRDCLKIRAQGINCGVKQEVSTSLYLYKTFTFQLVPQHKGTWQKKFAQRVLSFISTLRVHRAKLREEGRGQCECYSSRQITKAISKWGCDWSADGYWGGGGGCLDVSESVDF